MSARYVNNLSRYLMLSLGVHSLLTLGLLQFMSTATPDLDSLTPVSVTFTAPALATVAPHLDQRPQLYQPPHVIARARTLTQPVTPVLATVPFTTANAAWPTPENANAPLPRRAPPNRYVSVERLSAPAADEPAAVPPTSQTAPTASITASASPLDASRRKRLARQQATGSQSPQFVYQPKPHYPIIARRRGWQGTVMLTIEMLSDGTVGTIKVATSSGYPALDSAAQEAVRKWRHRPLQHNGSPLTRQANLPIHFRLD